MVFTAKTNVANDVMIPCCFCTTQKNQKKLIQYITTASVNKVVKILEAGLDPNFIADDGSEGLNYSMIYNKYMQFFYSNL